MIAAYFTLAKLETLQQDSTIYHILAVNLWTHVGNWTNPKGLLWMFVSMSSQKNDGTSAAVKMFVFDKKQQIFQIYVS